MLVHVRLNRDIDAKEAVVHWLEENEIEILDQSIANLLVVDIAGDQLKHLKALYGVQGVENPETGKMYR